MKSGNGTSSRFEWESAVLGPGGPPSPITRFVLLAIGAHVKRKGSVQCWPSIRTLTEKTRLGRRTVIDHVDIGVSDGWVEKQIGKTGDMRQPGSIFTLTVPSGARGLLDGARGRGRTCMTELPVEGF